MTIDSSSALAVTRSARGGIGGGVTDELKQKSFTQKLWTPHRQRKNTYTLPVFVDRVSGRSALLVSTTARRLPVAVSPRAPDTAEALWLMGRTGGELVTRGDVAPPAALGGRGDGGCPAPLAVVVVAKPGTDGAAAVAVCGELPGSGAGCCVLAIVVALAMVALNGATVTVVLGELPERGDD